MKTAKRISKKAAKKLVANANRRTARANKAFEALTPSEKRVTIARDVLSQIRLKRLVPKSGYWLTGKNGSDLFNKAQVIKNPELRDVLKGVKQCQGCALGGMFMCAVERADKLKLNELSAGIEFNNEVEDAKSCGNSGKNVTLNNTGIDEDDAFGYLSKFFPREQLDLIESCFERNGGASYSDEAEDFAPECEDSSERMRLIMENIVVNRGRFCPSQAPVIRYETAGFVG